MVHHGCHFGRAVHTFCSIQTLLTNSIVHMGEDNAEILSSVYVLQLLSTQPVTNILDSREQKELVVFCELLKMVPGLEAWLMESLEDDVITIADFVRFLVVLWLIVPADLSARFRKA